MHKFNLTSFSSKEVLQSRQVTISSLIHNYQSSGLSTLAWSLINKLLYTHDCSWFRIN